MRELLSRAPGKFYTSALNILKSGKHGPGSDYLNSLMLENDLFLERFFDRHSATLTQRQASALGELMELSDNDLLDLHLGRKTPADMDARLDRADITEVLALLRNSN